MAKAIDLTGQKFGKLTVIERDYDYAKEHNLKQKIVHWRCQCDCGNYITVSSQSLRAGSTIQCSLCKSGNEIGKRYGRLIVLGPAEKKSKGSSSWLCQCDCGKQTIVHAWDLRSGRTTSCGCYFQEVIRNKTLVHNSMSEQEVETFNLLARNNINFLYDEPFFEDLHSINKGICRYDFIILDENKKPIRLIEIDGQQHFKEIKLFDKKPGDFEKRLINDNIKNKYAVDHNIPLVRIPYTEKNKMSLELIFSDKYLITSEDLY